MIDKQSSLMTGKRSHVGGDLHASDQCDATFSNWRALAMHQRTRHSRTSASKWFASEHGMCPVCGVGFSSGLRLIAHLTEKRVRCGRRPCFDFLTRAMRLHGVFPILPAAVGAE